MLPNRTNEVIRSVLGGGVAAAVITLLTVTTLNTETLKVGSGGTTMDGAYRSTLTVNPDSIAANGATTTVVTVTGAAASDHCGVNVLSGDLDGTTSTVRLSCRAGTNNATVYYRNTSSTAAFDAGSSVLSVEVRSY